MHPASFARAIALLVSSLALSACATVRPDADMPAVREAVAERTGATLAWPQDADAEATVRAAVARLLEQGLTAQSAIQIALINNPAQQARFESLGIAQADLVEAGLIANPVLGVSAVFGDPGSIIEGVLMQELVELLSMPARKRAGESSAQRVAFEVAQDAVRLAREVAAAYYQVVGDEQAIELLRQATTATEAGAELAARQFDAGNLSARERALQQAFHAQTVLELARAQAQLQADREKLNRLMGLSGPDTQWTTPTRLPPLAASLPTLDSVETVALDRRLDLAAAKKRAQAAGQVLGLARDFRYLDTLGVGVAFKREPGDDGYDRYVGPEVAIGIPIFNQGQARVARAQAEYRRSVRQVEGLAVDIGSQAREARIRVIAAHSAALHYERVLLPLQESVVSETLKFYNGMLVGVYELLLARQSQLAVARQYVATARDFWIAWADLEQAVGTRIPMTPESVEPPASRSDASHTQSSHQHGDR